MIVRLLAVLSLAAAFTLVFPKAANAADGLPEHKISVQQGSIGLRDALTSLLDDTNMKYKLSNNVTNDKKISIDIKDAKWSDVFKFLLDEGKLNYRVTAKKRVLVSP
ncbi:MAG TPA: hypothetical protein VFV50_14095 [Bdellovibrionales bacterium]|nr:hypothetical protein [Bdellovibrionales bacterium]